MPAFTLPVEDDPLPWLTEQFREAGALERLSPTEPTVKALSAALGLTSSIVTALSNHPKRFSVRFSPSIGTTASTSTKRHEVVIGLKPMLDPRLTDGQRASLMVSLAYHEVGHVIFTAPLVKRLEKEYRPETPRGKWLFRIVNIVHDVLLEDQQPKSYPGYAPTLTVKRAYWGRLWNPTLRDRRQRLGALTQAALYDHGTDWTTSESLAEFYAWAQDWTERCKAVKPRLGTPKACEFAYLDALVREAAEHVRIDDPTVEPDPEPEPVPGEEEEHDWDEEDDPDGDAADPFDDTEDEPESDLGGESDDESDDTDDTEEEDDEESEDDGEGESFGASDDEPEDEPEDEESEDGSGTTLPEDDESWDDIDEMDDPGQALPDPEDEPESKDETEDAASGGESTDDGSEDDDEGPIDLDDEDDEDETDDGFDPDDDDESDEDGEPEDGDEESEDDDSSGRGDIADGDSGDEDSEDGDHEWVPEAHERDDDEGIAAEWQGAIDEYDRVQVSGRDKVVVGGGGSFHRREVRIIRLR